MKDEVRQTENELKSAREIKPQSKKTISLFQRIKELEHNSRQNVQ
jgi:hypothetical protein